MPCWELFEAQSSDDLDEYCDFVREQTDLRLGIEADFVPGREDRMANLLDGRDWDYVVGSIHFLRDEAIDLRGVEGWEHTDVWRSNDPDKVWARYFETLGEAARSGLFDILAHPDLVKVWGKGAPRPGRRPAPLLRARHGRHRRIRRRDRGVDRGAAQAGRRDLPRRAFLELCLRPAGRWRCHGRAPARAAGARVRAGRRMAARVGVTRSRCSSDASGAWSPWDDGSVRASAGTLTASRTGRPLVLGGVTIAADRGLAGHSDADVLTHAVIDALLGAAALGDIGAALPRHRRALARRGQHRAAARGRGLLAERGLAPVNLDHRRVRAAEARPLPRCDARATRRGAGLDLDASASSSRPARGWASSAAARASPRSRWRRSPERRPQWIRRTLLRSVGAPLVVQRRVAPSASCLANMRRPSVFNLTRTLELPPGATE